MSSKHKPALLQGRWKIWQALIGRGVSETVFFLRINLAHASIMPAAWNKVQTHVSTASCRRGHIHACYHNLGMATEHIFVSLHRFVSCATSDQSVSLVSKLLCMLKMTIGKYPGIELSLLTVSGDSCVGRFSGQRPTVNAIQKQP